VSYSTQSYEDYMVPSLFGPWAKVLVEAANPQPGERLLDVACGTGIVARTAASRIGTQGMVAGLDINPDMIAVARTIAERDHLAIEWRTGTAGQLPFSEAEFDLVLCQFGLMFFPDRSASLGEMRRVLKPGGRVLLSVWQGLEPILSTGRCTTRAASTSAVKRRGRVLPRRSRGTKNTDGSLRFPARPDRTRFAVGSLSAAGRSSLPGRSTWIPLPRLPSRIWITRHKRLSCRPSAAKCRSRWMRSCVGTRRSFSFTRISPGQNDSLVARTLPAAHASLPGIISRGRSGDRQPAPGSSGCTSIASIPVVLHWRRVGNRRTVSDHAEALEQKAGESGPMGMRRSHEALLSVGAGTLCRMRFSDRGAGRGGRRAPLALAAAPAREGAVPTMDGAALATAQSLVRKPACDGKTAPLLSWLRPCLTSRPTHESARDFEYADPETRSMAVWLAVFSGRYVIVPQLPGYDVLGPYDDCVDVIFDNAGRLVNMGDNCPGPVRRPAPRRH